MNDVNTEWTFRLLRHRLDDLRRAGVRQLPRATAAPPNAAVHESVATTLPAVSESLPHDGTNAMSSEKTAAPDQRLRVLAEHVSQCQLCPELCSTRTQTVFGVGNPSARLCFLGEAPGADEDRLGEPFVGRAGQLLNKIIAACTLRREDVYILNILKCRPPGNRNPLPAEAANCADYLKQQFDIIQPEFICCLGSVAASNLLDTKEPIGRLRGRIHHWRGIQVVATYHPAYLLRNPPAKAEVWKDMQFLMAAMGIELPTASK